MAATGTYHHGDLRRAMITTATEVLEEGGPERLSMREVARRAGVSSAAPYNHFDGKQGLLAAVATAGFEDLAASQRAAAAGPDALAAMGVDYVAAALARPQRFRLMFGTGIEDWSAHPDLAAAKSAAVEPLVAVIARDLLPGAPTTAVDTAKVTLWSLVHGLATLLVEGSLAAPAPVDGLVRDALALGVAGVQSAADIPPSTNTSAPLR